MKTYFQSNKEHWNKRVSIHLKSDMYGQSSFLEGRNSLNHPELKHFGDVKGKDILHLQCHFGQDSLSLQRMGAQVTGLDFSSEAIAKAREFNKELNLNAQFVEANVMEAEQQVSGKFDWVFTSYGTIVWIPRLAHWAKNIAHFLKEGGEFLMVDFHPVMYMLDDDYSEFGYPYFTREEPFADNISETYTENKEGLSGTEYFWNHPTSSIFTALLNAGLELKAYEEFPYSCYKCFPHMEKISDEHYQFTKHKGNIPYMYLMRWQKKSL
ncbi:MAG: class I SAM-dependent methyltransferase [Bacteroidota bacterium]